MIERSHSGSRRWIWFVAGRYLRSRRKERKLSTSLLSIIGIAVGVLALVSVIGVMNGFQLGTIEDILELNSFHLQWRPDLANPPADEDDLDALRLAAENLETAAEVRSAQPFLDTQALVQGNFADLQGIYLRGIDPAAAVRDPRGRALHTLVQGRGIPSEPGTVVLGRELARFLGVRTGDSISLVSISDPDLDLRSPEEILLEVSGIFETGYYPYDRNWGIVSLETLRKDFHLLEMPRIGVKLEDRFRDIQAVALLEPRLPGGSSAPEGLESVPGTLETWRSLNRAIFGALRVEKGMMLFLVSLIFLVVGVNIYQGLRRVIHERYSDIGVLKALGAGPRQIEAVFILEGWLIGGIGSALGLALGIAVSLNVNQILSFFEGILGRGRTFAVEYFYLASIPVDLIPGEVAMIGAFGLAAAVLAAFGASRAVRDVTPLDVFREE